MSTSSPASADSEGYESEYVDPTDHYKQEIAERFDEIRKWRKVTGLTPEPLSIRPAPQVTLEKMREALGTLDPKSQ